MDRVPEQGRATSRGGVERRAARGRKSPDRRGCARAQLHGEVVSRVATAAATTLNVSDGGALLALATGLRPGALYVVKLVIAPGQEVTLKSRVVRSEVYDLSRTAGGESVMTFHVGVEFVDLAEPDREALRNRVAQIEGVLDEEPE